MTIGNATTNTWFSNPIIINLGQSFINDPSGSGASINLDSWTFAFNTTTGQTNAAALPLRIYQGTGTTSGVIVGSSSSVANTTYAGFPGLTWTFTGLQLSDNETYTAVVFGSTGASIELRASAPGSTYSDGIMTTESGNFTNVDATFQGNFSAATPVPFDFNPSVGLVSLGVLWAGKKFLNKKRFLNKLQPNQQ